MDEKEEEPEIGGGVSKEEEGEEEPLIKDEETSDTSSSSSESVSFSFRKMTKQQKGLLISICFTEFLIMCCNSLISPLLPPQANSRGISGQMQGWIMASFAGGQFLIFPVFGKYVSRIGSKFMFLSGIFIAGGCTILIGCLEFVPYQDGAMVFESLCFVLQVAVSIGVTAEQTAAFAVASKEFSGYFTTVFGVTEVFVGLGLTIGPLVGGVLSDVGGFFLPYTVLGALVLASLPFNSCLTPSLVDEPTTAKLRRKSGLSLLRHPSIIITCLAVVVGSGVWSVLDPCLEPHLELFNLTPSKVGAVFLLLSASYALSCALCGWIAEKLPDNRLLMIPGFLLCGIAHCLLAPSPLFGFDDSNNQLWMIMVALLLLGVAMSMAIIPSYDIIMEIATETGYPDNLSTHGLVAGLWSSMYALGEFIGPIWGGYIQDIIGLPWGLTYTAGACILVVVLLTIMAVYDCYCCEAEDDEDGIREKKALLTKEIGYKQRIRSMSEPMRRRRHLSSILEISSQSSSSSSSNSTLVSSMETRQNFGYGTMESNLALPINSIFNQDVKYLKIIKNVKKQPTIRSKSLGFIYPPRDIDSLTEKIQGFNPTENKNEDDEDPIFISDLDPSFFTVTKSLSCDDSFFEQDLINPGPNNTENINNWCLGSSLPSNLLTTTHPEDLTTSSWLPHTVNMAACSQSHMSSNMASHSISNTSTGHTDNSNLLSKNDHLSDVLVQSSRKGAEETLLENNRPSSSQHYHIYPDVIIKQRTDKINKSASGKQDAQTGVDNSDKQEAMTGEDNSIKHPFLERAGKKLSVTSKLGSTPGADNSTYVSTAGADNSNKYGSTTREEKTSYKSLKVKVRSRQPKTSEKMDSADQSGMSKRPSTPVTFSPRDIIRSPMIKTLINAPNNQKTVATKSEASGKIYQRNVSNPGERNEGKKLKKRLGSTSINDDDVIYSDTRTEFQQIYQNNMLP